MTISKVSHLLYQDLRGVKAAFYYKQFTLEGYIIECTVSLCYCFTLDYTVDTHLSLWCSALTLCLCIFAYVLIKYVLAVCSW